MQRRTFLASSFAASAAAMLLGQRAWSLDVSDERNIYTTLKIGMVGVPGSLTDKFKAVKEAGFDGIELDAPGFNVEEALAAIKATGLPVDGTVGSSHWSIRHTSPKADERKTALDHLKQAIHDTHAVGGHTTLLVVGHGQDGEEAELIERSVENISKALPLAAELGVIIAVENVWNHFLYDHQGGRDQTADKLAAYIDAFQSPWVGMQFDIGNHWKYGDPAAWIRTLGKRVVKLDAKSYSREKEDWGKTITDCDINWSEVRQALKDINFSGWAAAEVGGGNAERLAEISKDMKVAFGIA
jgi:L-ribulose-5-phosphate 3-epimerase